MLVRLALARAHAERVSMLTSDCFASSAASFTIVTVLFFPNGRLVSG